MDDLKVTLAQNAWLIILSGVALLSNWGVAWVKKKREEHNVKDLQKTKVFDLKIDAKLAELRVLCDADRVKLFQFHNGGKYFNGQSIKKISLTNCLLKPGVSSPKVQDWQNIPTSFIINFLNDMSVDKVFTSSVEVLEDNYLQQLLTSNGTKQIMSIEIESTRQEIIAIIIISWINELPLISDLEGELLSYSKQIGADLTFS